MCRDDTTHSLKYFPSLAGLCPSHTVTYLKLFLFLKTRHETVPTQLEKIANFRVKFSLSSHPDWLISIKLSHNVWLVLRKFIFWISSTTTDEWTLRKLYIYPWKYRVPQKSLGKIGTRRSGCWGEQLEICIQRPPLPGKLVGLYPYRISYTDRKNPKQRKMRPRYLTITL